MAKRNKTERINFRIREELKEKYYAACEYRLVDPTEDLTRHIIAFTREAEKEMREKGIMKAPGE